MKVQVKTAIKRAKKNMKKADSLFQNQCPNFLLPSLFRRISQTSGQDQQNGEQKYCRLPPHSFRIKFKDTPSYISMDS